MTEDLPTPPLPDAIARMRVFEFVNGFGCERGACGAVASVTASGFGIGSPRSRAANFVSSPSVGSVTENSTRAMPSSAVSASVMAAWSAPR